VKAVTQLPHIEREMALIDVNAKSGESRQEIMSLVEIFRAKVVDISHDRMILEASGSSDKVAVFIEMLKPIGINNVTRSGCVAINRISPLEK
jgi:acetolactate synthase I/III small subunit